MTAAEPQHHGGTARPAVDGRERVSRRSMPGGVEALNDITLDFPEGRADDAARPVGLRQDHAAQDHRRPDPAERRQVRVDGKDVTGPGPERAFVFQDFALMPWATVMRNVAFGLELRGIGKAERQGGGAEIYRRTSASRVSRTPIRTSCPAACASASGLARALAVNAKVLLMDEPFSAVDEQTRRKFQEDLLRAGRAGAQDIHLRDAFDRGGGLCLGPDRRCCRSGRAGCRKSSSPISIAAAIPNGSAASQAYLDTVEAIWQGLKRYLD